MDPDYTRAVKVGIETLSQPFVHTEAFNPADGLPDSPVEADYDSTEAYEAVEDAYWARCEDVVFRPEHSIVALPVSPWLRVP